MLRWDQRPVIQIWRAEGLEFPTRLGLLHRQTIWALHECRWITAGTYQIEFAGTPASAENQRVFAGPGRGIGGRMAPYPCRDCCQQHHDRKYGRDISKDASGAFHASMSLPFLIRPVYRQSVQSSTIHSACGLRA